MPSEGLICLVGIEQARHGDFIAALQPRLMNCLPPRP